MKQVAGQALVNGITMTGKKCTSIVKRRESGRLVIETKSKRIVDEKKNIDKIPIVRGVYKFFVAIRDGISIFSFYNNKIDSKKDKESNFLNLINKSNNSKTRFLFTILLSVFIFILSFFILPEIITDIFVLKDKNMYIYSLVKMIIRFLIVFLYLIIISRSRDFSSILRYHGAEHKVINCYESKMKLNIENVKKCSKFHKRCGSNFVLYFIIIYFISTVFLPKISSIRMIAIEFLIFPIVIGLTNEILEYVSRSNSGFSYLLFSLGEAVQFFTTKEPSEDEIEVSIVALKIAEGLKVKNNVKELFLTGRTILRDARIDSYALDSRIILEYVLGISPTEVFTSESEVKEDDEKKYLDMIEERKTGKPLAYLIGKKEFYGNEFVVKQGVLIPRPDSEVLVEKVLDILKDKQNVSICDLCCGSGAVGISIQKNNEEVNCTYIDIKDTPIKVTQENLYIYDLKNRSYVVKSDLLSFFIENGLELDGIVSNPPYIRTSEIETLMKDVKDFEPREALDGGEDGLDFYRKICSDANKVLVENGFLAFEIPYNKAFDIMYIMTNNNFVNIDTYKDINEKDRVIIGYYKSKIDY